MLVKTGFLFLLAAALQVSAEFVKPGFVEVLREQEVAAHGANRIVSGWVAQPGQHPHHAALRMVDAAGGVSACGGSIVHTDWVVTAAHCTAARITIVVRGGVVSLTTPQYIFETREWYNYPTYDNLLPSVVQPNDISIMKVQKPFVYTAYLQPIRIQPTVDSYRNYEELQLYASGHGLTWTGGSTTEVLNWVYLRGVSNALCRSTFGTIITDTTICARFFNVTSQSTCSGDSGGPLVHVNDEGVPILIGVASFAAAGSVGCHSGYPAGFIRPGPFLSWFEEITGIDFEALEDVTEPPVEEETEPPVEEETEPPVEEETEPPVEEETEPPVEEDDDDDSESSEEDDDDETAQILKRLQIKVNVKVNINKYGKKIEKEVDKEVNKHH